MVTFLKFSDIQPKPPTWLWDCLIPFGEITLLDGDPGVNKTAIAIDLASRVSTGRSMPDDSPVETGTVVFSSAEDSVSKTLHHRLTAAGANLQRVVTPDKLRFPDDLDSIREFAIQHDVRLFVVDPLSAHFEKSVANEQATRRVLEELREIADECGMAVLAIRHLAKASGRSTNLLYRGLGSIGVAGAARSVLHVVRHPDDSNQRILVPVKSNLSSRGNSWLFEPVNQDGTVAIRWNGECELTAEELCGDCRSAPQLDRAVKVLLEKLQIGPMPQSEVKQLAASEGIGFRTFERAKVLLGIDSRPKGFQGESVWKLLDPAANVGGV